MLKKLKCYFGFHRLDDGKYRPYANAEIDLQLYYAVNPEEVLSELQKGNTPVMKE